MATLTFLGLAEQILKEEKRPLSPREIWKIAIAKGYDKQMNIRGKTPDATLYSLIFSNTRDNPNTVFVKRGERPARYLLREQVAGAKDLDNLLTGVDYTAPELYEYLDDADNRRFSDPPEEDESKIDHIPKGERTLHTQPYDFSISEIVNKINSGDIVLDPDYQRNYIWDDKRASLLVESILLNVPIPVVYVAEQEDGKWDVVDGLQRLNSLKRFFANEFKLKGLDVLDELNKASFKDLDPKASRILRNGILRIIKISNDSHPDIKYEIFMRLNRGAVKLTEQELRNCLYRGTFNDMLQELRQEKIVQRLLDLEAPDIRMADAEILLRQFTIRGGYDQITGKISTYSGNMRSSLNHYMSKVRNISDDEARALKRQFLEDAAKVEELFGENAFHRINADGTFDDRPNRAIMDAVLTGVIPHSIDALKHKKPETVGLLKRLITDDKTFDDAITIRTSVKQKMEYRVHTFSRDLAALLNR